MSFVILAAVTLGLCRAELHPTGEQLCSSGARRHRAACLLQVQSSANDASMLVLPTEDHFGARSGSGTSAHMALMQEHQGNWTSDDPFFSVGRPPLNSLLFWEIFICCVVIYVTMFYSSELVSRLASKRSDTQSTGGAASSTASHDVAEAQLPAVVDAAKKRRLPSSSTLVALVEEQAACIPNETFLQVWDAGNKVTKTFTFREFADEVERVAAVLHEKGVYVGERIGFLAHGTAVEKIHLLACMKLGAVPVLLGWRQPETTICNMLRLARCTKLLSSQHFAVQARAMATEVTAVGAPLILEELATSEAAANTKEWPAVSAEDCAVILFTSGSTATPKAVPHTHWDLVWNCRNMLHEKSSAFPSDAPCPGTVCFLPNFHAIGFTVNFVFNLFSGIRSVVLEAPQSSPVTPGLLLQACADLQPTILSTVPWVIEAMSEMLQKGDPAAKCLLKLHHIAFAGAQLSPACHQVMNEHGVRLAVDYGQTELGGALLFGTIGGSPSLMRPVTGVSYSFLDANNLPTKERKGELVLHGAQSALKVYLEGSGGRPLSSAGRKTSEEYWTGDIFEEVVLSDGSSWIKHCSRHDDLLVHTSGEMTNPLPMEKGLIGKYDFIDTCCVLGGNLPRAAIVVQLATGTHGRDHPELAAKLWTAIEEANKLQPEWSHVLPQHVLVLWKDKDKNIPISVKGEVQRNLLQKRMQPTLNWLLSNGPEDAECEIESAEWLKHNLGPDFSSQENSMDSLALSKGASFPAEVGYLYFFCILGVIVSHHEHAVLLFGLDMPSLMHPKDVPYGIIMDAMSAFTLPGFALYAGYQDLIKQPTVLSLGAALIPYLGGYALNVLLGVPHLPWFLMFLAWARLIAIIINKIPSVELRQCVQVFVGTFTHFGLVSGIGPDDGESLFPGHRYLGLGLFLYYFAFSHLLKLMHGWLTKADDAKTASILFGIPIGVYVWSVYDPIASPSFNTYQESWAQSAPTDLFHSCINFVLICCILPWLPKTPSFISTAGGNSLMIYIQSEMAFMKFFFWDAYTFGERVSTHAGTLIGGSATPHIKLFTLLMMEFLVTCFLGMDVQSFLPKKLRGGAAPTLLFVAMLFGQIFIFAALLNVV